MSSVLPSLRDRLRAFLAGGPFLPLRTAVLDAADAVDADPDLSDDAREWFDELHEAVSMAADDPVAPSDRKAGVVGVAELRAHLRDARLDAGPVA